MAFGRKELDIDGLQLPDPRPDLFDALDDLLAAHPPPSA